MNEKLINLCANSISLNLKFRDKIWVYAIYDSREQLVFMYYGTLKEIIEMRPFKTNEKFNENETYRYVILKPYDNKVDAENALGVWMNVSELKGSMPPYNIYSQGYNNNSYIYCVDNGRYYKSAQDVVKIFNISQPALSNHLRGVTGYRHVKGLTFKFHHGPRPAEIEMAGGFKMQQVGPNGGYRTIPSDDPLNRPNLTNEQIKQEIEKSRVNGLMAQLTQQGGNLWS